MSIRHHTFRLTSWSVLVAACLLLASGSVRAQSTTNQPWSTGVSPQQQKHAETLYQEGNRDFTNGFFASAVTKYQAALQHWNHPGIHYNLALALISLDRPIEAYQSIVAALSHGTDALHPEEYQRALDNKRALLRQIAVVEVICEEPGAAVTLDGKPLFTGPGRVTTMVLPGKHQIVASKVEYLTATRAFKLAGEERTRLELRLVAAYQSSTRVQHRRTWPRWAATGLGLGAGATAAMLHWQFRIDSDRLSDTLRKECPTGCPAYPEELVPLRERLEWQRNVAYAGYAAAGALLATGAVLMYLDRTQTTKTRARHEGAQLSLSAGDPGGSPGISIHIPF
jgi:hypothetical protein